MTFTLCTVLVNLTREREDADGQQRVIGCHLLLADMFWCTSMGLVCL